MWLIIPGLILLVVYLAHATDNQSAPSGTPNGVNISAQTSAIAPLGPDNALPYLGATGQPSPFTGLGRPGASNQVKQINFLQPPPSRRNNGSAFDHPRRMHTTGLLDPLPKGGTGSKKLVTQDMLNLPGTKV